METIIVAALQAGALIIVALFGLYGARKLGIGQNQEKLVSTLKELIDAQNLKIEELEKNRTEDRERIEKLEAEVKDLKDLTIEQALEITKERKKNALLEKKLKMQAENPEGGE